MEKRTYWASFCNNGFLGALVVDVTSEDVELIRSELDHLFPDHEPIEGPWIAAVVRISHNAKVNPGGEIALWRMDENGHDLSIWPRLKLMSRDEIGRIQGSPAQSIGEIEGVI